MEEEENQIYKGKFAELNTNFINIYRADFLIGEQFN